LQFEGMNQPENISNNFSDKDLLLKFYQHPWWNKISGWNHRLNYGCCSNHIFIIA
jgi:hypothetical protein